MLVSEHKMNWKSLLKITYNYAKKIFSGIKKSHTNVDNKNNVLIIANNFTGGGLEHRINNIVNKFSYKYNFSLITKTPAKSMKTRPSASIIKIYKWTDYKKALKNADIIDVHPWKISKIYKKWGLFTKKNITKKIYTLHGEASLNEDLHFLQYVDRVYCVGDSLIKAIKCKYPNVKDIHLLKNYDSISCNNNFSNESNNILFSITNLSDINFIQEIINTIPEQYTIHIIGNIDSSVISKNNKHIIFHGFVNLTDFFRQYKFMAAFSRGGFASQDIIAKDIPCFLISSNKYGFYMECLTRDNFVKLSDNNFVTREPFNKKYLITQLSKINPDYKKYLCSDLLIDYNDISIMEDPYDF